MSTTTTRRAVLAGAESDDDSDLLVLGNALDETDRRFLALCGYAAGRGGDVDAAWAAVAAVVDKIEAIPAHTLEGLRGKARAISWCHSGERPIEFQDDPTTDIRLAQSIVADLLRAA